ncbi:hypothetical protein O0I10_005176 [Lichtheimia ornata]|uniref:GATA-type domain-containing protein n=1 Tax=Lichtheimia ornata TaxID=688661 RepID=A0AAD7Y1S6_9FUNG|nr:uncharacterized protein O0I10_005176 [Lichtheimia ornata]KAJ8659137.1 hypothetical protein O0I10_005176 [Lichtheimia ornata]
MSPASKSNDDMPHLPPISAIDECLPNRTWQPPTSSSSAAPSQQSSPSTSSYSLNSNSNSSNSSSSTPHYPQHYATTTTTTIPLHPQATRAWTMSSRQNENHQVANHPDLPQIIHHCQHICDSIIAQQRNQDVGDPRPWLDELIGRANEILNALLNLRKQQASLPVTMAKSSSRPSSPTPTSSSSTAVIPSSWQSHSIHRLRQQRRRGRATAFQGRCHSCNISETPEWRRGPDGARTLCNACGLHYAKITRKKATANTSSSSSSSPSLSSTTQQQQQQHR